MTLLFVYFPFFVSYFNIFIISFSLHHITRFHNKMHDDQKKIILAVK